MAEGNGEEVTAQGDGGRRWYVKGPWLHGFVVACADWRFAEPSCVTKEVAERFVDYLNALEDRQFEQADDGMICICRHGLKNRDDPSGHNEFCPVYLHWSRAALEDRNRDLEAERDSIQHQEIAAAQAEFNEMRGRATSAEAEAARWRGLAGRYRDHDADHSWECADARVVPNEMLQAALKGDEEATAAIDAKCALCTCGFLQLEADFEAMKESGR